MIVKKVLSLGLVLAMTTSTAFAASLSPKNIEPGAEINVRFDEFSDPNNLYIGGKRCDSAAAVDDGFGQQIGGAGSPADGLVGPSEIDAKTFKISTSKNGETNLSAEYYNDVANTKNKKLGANWTSNNATYLLPVSAGGASGFSLKIEPGATANESTQAQIDAAKKKIDMLARQDIQAYDFTAQNFRATLRASKGQDLVKGLSFDGAGNLVITFKDDYRLPSKNGSADFVLTELSVQSIRDVKSSGNVTNLYAGRKFVADPTKVADGKFYSEQGSPVTVGVDAVEVQLISGSEHTMQGDGTWEKFSGTDVYRASTKYDNGGLTVTGTVYSGDVTSFKVGSEVSQQVINVMNSNPNAKIDVYPIVAKGFKAGFSVAIKPKMVAGAVADAAGNVEVLSAISFNNKKIYTVDNAGALSLAAFTYNAATGAWEGRIPATGATILVSDVALVGVTAATTTTPIVNPGTGFAVDVAAAIVR